MSKKVSIIIPVYNTETYLDECITSAINQTYRNIEIILVNDGSTDSSLSICKRYKKLDNRIKIISIKNSGVSYARNKGLESSIGSYVMFLDSDDYYDLDYVERMYDAITKNKCDIVISGFSCFTSKSKRTLEYSNTDKILEFSSIINDIIWTSHFNSISKTIMRKKVIDDNNIQFDVSLKYFEDLKLSFTVMKYSKRIMYLSNCLYNYRMNADSSTQTINIEKSLKWYNDECSVLDFISLNSDVKGIDSVKFLGLCITLRILCKSSNTTYPTFKETAVNLLDSFYSKTSKKDIVIKNMKRARKIDRLRMRLIYKNHLKLFYYITKIEKFILNIIR